MSYRKEQAEKHESQGKLADRLLSQRTLKLGLPELSRLSGGVRLNVN